MTHDMSQLEELAVKPQRCFAFWFYFSFSNRKRSGRAMI
jgi:hypothetical protein